MSSIYVEEEVKKELNKRAAKIQGKTGEKATPNDVIKKLLKIWLLHYRGLSFKITLMVKFWFFLLPAFVAVILVVLRRLELLATALTDYHCQHNIFSWTTINYCDCMTNVFSKEKRSWIISRIRSKWYRFKIRTKQMVKFD